MIAFIFVPHFHRQPDSAALGRRITCYLISRAPGVERAGGQAWFIDLTGCDRLFRQDFAGWGVQIAGLLRDRFGVRAKVGMAPNKVLAEFACRLARGRGVVCLSEEGARLLLARSSLELVPRLTDAQRSFLRDRRLGWVREVLTLGEDCLRHWFGLKEGSALWLTLQGLCDEPVKPCRLPRLLKKGMSFAPPTAARQEVVSAGVYLGSALFHEMERLGGVVRRVNCRVIYVDDLEATREVHVGHLCTEGENVAAVARMLEVMPMRRVQVKRLELRCPVEFEPAEQQDLFAERERIRRRDLEKALRDVREKYGVEALHRVSGTVRNRAPRAPRG